MQEREENEQAQEDDTQERDNQKQGATDRKGDATGKRGADIKKKALLAAAVSLTGLPLAALGSLTGLSASALVGAIIGYDAIFGRCNRPDYALTAGVRCISRAHTGLERQLKSFDSDGVRLQGYYYPAKAPKGLTVVCHGIRSGADDYLPIIEYMVNSGYSVFAFDYKGTYDSDGDSTVGMCESLVDLDHALNYIECASEFCHLPITLIGHSWGGYAVASVLPLHKRVVACATISAPNNGYTLILEKGEQYGGRLASKGVPEVFLNVYQKKLFGKYTDMDGVKGINGTDIPVLIAHGSGDKLIDINRQAVYAHREELRQEGVAYYTAGGVRGGHDTIWHSERAAEYQASVDEQIKAMKRGGAMPYEKKVEFFAGIDHRLYSEVNEELFEQIIRLFDGACVK